MGGKSGTLQNRIVGNAVFYLPTLRDALVLQPYINFNSTGPVGGPFIPSDISFTLSNFDINPLDWEISETITWLDLTAPQALVGISKGWDLPPGFKESDLSKYSTCALLGDVNNDNIVDMNDMAILTAHWLYNDCNFPDWCAAADINRDKSVNFADYQYLLQNWNKIPEIK